jgi:hypothetical protein
VGVGRAGGLGLLGGWRWQRIGGLLARILRAGIRPARRSF